jgi:hypothetical protein
MTGPSPLMLALLALAPLAQSSEVAAPPVQNIAQPFNDCGAHALYLLLRLRGHGVGMERVLDALPNRHPDGYSMAELTQAAGALGVPLEGRRIRPGDFPLDRPVIAYLENRQRSHYVVLRPVGRTGTMVQLLDPPFDPRVLDYDQLRKFPEWTGKALVPLTFAESAVPLALVLLLALVASLAPAKVIRNRVARGGPDGPSEAPVVPGDEMPAFQ